MRKWKNPYLTLSLPPTAAGAEIRAREKLLSEGSPEDQMAARWAREELTQNIGRMLPAFVTAIPGLASLEADIRILKRGHRVKPELTPDVMREAFDQQGIMPEAGDAAPLGFDTGLVDGLSETLSLAGHLDEFPSPSPEAAPREEPRPPDEGGGEPIRAPGIIGEEGS